MTISELKMCLTAYNRSLNNIVNSTGEPSSEDMETYCVNFAKLEEYAKENDGLYTFASFGLDSEESDLLSYFFSKDLKKAKEIEWNKWLERKKHYKL